jgi:hypothetical protein
MMCPRHVPEPVWDVLITTVLLTVIIGQPERFWFAVFTPMAGMKVVNAQTGVSDIILMLTLRQITSDDHI